MRRDPWGGAGNAVLRLSCAAIGTPLPVTLGWILVARCAPAPEAWLATIAALAVLPTWVAAGLAVVLVRHGLRSWLGCGLLTLAFAVALALLGPLPEAQP
jgi:hypothetical protein